MKRDTSLFLVRLPRFAFLLLFAGCSAGSREQELKEQKLLLELGKANTERLTELAKKEEDLKSLEKNTQVLLEELKQQQLSIANRENELALKEKDFVERLAAAEARIREETKALDAGRDEVQAQTKEVGRVLSVMRQKGEAERAARETALREQAERQRPEIVDRLNRRKPHLDELVNLTTDLAVQHHAGLVRSDVRKQLSFSFSNLKWGKIEEDDAFARAARDEALSYLKLHLGDIQFATHGGPLISALTKWETDYVKNNQRTKGR